MVFKVIKQMGFSCCYLTNSVAVTKWTCQDCFPACLVWCRVAVLVQIMILNLKAFITFWEWSNICTLQILALALEGRSRKGTRRRPNTSAYRKLDSNLEEAVTSTCSTSVTHVIYWMIDCAVHFCWSLLCWCLRAPKLI